MQSGRRTKLNPEIQKAILDVLRNGGPRSAACARAQISDKTLYDWLKKGEEGVRGPYTEFLHGVRDAEAQAILLAVRTVRLHIVGGWHKVPARDKEGNYLFERDENGQIIRDEQGRPVAMLVDEYQEPDLAAAQWWLERRDCDNFGGGKRVVDVNLNPGVPAVAELKPAEKLDLFTQAVQILVDNGYQMPAAITDQSQKAIEATATKVEVGA